MPSRLETKAIRDARLTSTEVGVDVAVGRGREVGVTMGVDANVVVGRYVSVGETVTTVMGVNIGGDSMQAVSHSVANTKEDNR